MRSSSIHERCEWKTHAYDHKHLYSNIDFIFKVIFRVIFKWSYLCHLGFLFSHQIVVLHRLHIILLPQTDSVSWHSCQSTPLILLLCTIWRSSQGHCREVWEWWGWDCSHMFEQWRYSKDQCDFCIPPSPPTLHFDFHNPFGQNCHVYSDHFWCQHKVLADLILWIDGILYRESHQYEKIWRYD